MRVTDDWGDWEVTPGKDCQVAVLVNPSQKFRDWQAAQPPPRPELARDLAKEIDGIKAKLGIK